MNLRFVAAFPVGIESPCARASLYGDFYANYSTGSVEWTLLQ